MLEQRIGYFVAQSSAGAAALSAAAVGEVMGHVFEFWRDTTGDYVHITPKALPQVTISLGTDPSQEDIRDAAVNALQALTPGVDPFDGLDCVFVLVHPGLFTFPNPVATPGVPTITRHFRARKLELADGRPITLVATGHDSYSTYCHELGHAFGFRHPFGLISTADDDLSTVTVETSAVYGSPYDIMGVWTIGAPPGATPAWSYTSSFPAAAVAGWPAALNQAQGPNVSRAQLYQRWPDSVHATVVNRPDAAHPLTAGIGAPSTPDPWKPERPGTVLVVRGANEPSITNGRILIEYRTAAGWDTGLTTAIGDSARAGVIVHQLASSAEGSSLWFRGAVFRDSADADLQLADGLVVTVLDWADDVVNVQLSVQAARSLRVDLVDEISRLRKPQDVEERHTPCGGRYRSGTWLTDLRAIYAARTTGFGGAGEFEAQPVAITWRIAGIAAPAPFGLLSIPAPNGPFDIRYSIDPQTYRLTVDCEPGDKFDVEVRAEVAADTAISGVARLNPAGSYTGIEPDGIAMIARCIKKLIPIPADWFVFKKPPNPLFGDLVDPRIGPQLEFWARDRVALIEELPEVSPDIKGALVSLIQAQLGEQRIG